MTKCCQTNNCVEIIPSGCVKYTGAIAPTGIIVKKEFCDPYINDIIQLFDTTIADLDVRVGLDKTQFDNVNNACGLTPVINTSSFTVKDNKYYSSEVVKSLVGVICELRSRLNYLISEDTNVKDPNTHWEDLKLSDEFRNYLSANASCLKDTCGVTNIVTLSDLLKALAVKICQCCN
jgi:hypothetical protein